MRVQIRKWARLWHRPMTHIPGAFLEDKGVALGIHFRRMLPAHTGAFRAVMRQLRKETADFPIRWQRGKKVWEALPDVAWDKGRAAMLLTRRLRHPFPVVIGDDETDEDMFRAFRGKGVTIVVGRTRSSAGWRIPRQSDVPRILEAICEARERRQK